MRNIVSLIIAFILAFSIIPFNSSAATTFKDVPNSHSYYKQISYLVENGFVSGYNDGTFKPENKLTRAHAALIIAKAMGLDLNNVQNPGYTDVPSSHPYYKQIATISNAGVMGGKENNKFDPNGNVTRGQMAVILTNAYNLAGISSKQFKDVTSSHWAYKFVQALANNNVTSGYSDGTFKPNGQITRAHFAVFLYSALGTKGPKMEVHFIDVGQGDSILIEAPNGNTMLIDGGTKASGDEVVSFLKSQNIDDLEYVVATHPDADHIGGLINVFAAYKVKNFINSGKNHTTDTYSQLLSVAVNEGSTYIEPTIGQSINLDSSLKVQVLNVNPNATDSNDASIVIKVTYNQVSFLLTGDANTGIESQMMSQFDVSSTILKAGHHGSNTSSSLSFLQKVKPAATILSYGEGNSYGHPHAVVLNNLKSVGSKVYSTAQDGTITVTTNGQTYNIDAMEFKGGSTSTTPSQPTSPEPSKPTGDVNSGTYVIPGAPTNFNNCTEMRKYYPNGVKSSHPAYASTHDRDNDGWACEQ
ncbi:MAG TPA: S-layer homology domain-containing protein [Ureibacillus sp.]|nr:S-layer homology domain-containing protein [Ureibacillus sp.]